MVTQVIVRGNRRCACGCWHPSESLPCAEHPTCIRWRMSEDERQARIDFELIEMMELEGRAPRLRSDYALSTLDLLDSFERGYSAQQTDFTNDPRVFLMRLRVSAAAYMRGISFIEIAIPEVAWSTAEENAANLLADWASFAEHHPDFGKLLLASTAVPDRPRLPLIGLCVVAEGLLSPEDGATDPQSYRPVRFVNAVDVDERQYTVFHVLSTGHRCSNVLTRAALDRVAGTTVDIGPHAADPVVTSIIPDSMRTIVRNLREAGLTL